MKIKKICYVRDVESRERSDQPQMRHLMRISRVWEH